MEAPTFTERLVRRRRVWWGPPLPGRGRSVADALHRLRERREPRSRHDPDEHWRCCESWPRTLLDKWNAREFAAKHGAPQVKLHWFGSDHGEAPLDSIGDRFVIRPTRGSNKQGVLVVLDGTERLFGGSATGADLRARLPRSRLLRRPAPMLLEEFAEPHDDGLLPLEYKTHTFGGHVGVVELMSRTWANDPRHRYYTPDWTLLPNLNTYADEDDLRDPPPCLGDMLSHASRLGEQIGTYMRIDFFVSNRGCLFNEFSSTPLGGGYNTPDGDRILGELWAERIGDAV
jgi:hypothetical protein